MKIIAHRGAWASAPENTLAAVRLAWQMDADAVEVDLRLTKDGRIVVIHDETTGRTAGRDLSVAHSTLTEIQSLAGGEERVPELREVLALTPAGKGVILELKSDDAILLPLEEELSAAGFGTVEVSLIAYDYALACAAKTRLPAIPVLWIVDSYRDLADEAAAESARRLLDEARAGGLDGLDLFAHTCVDRAFVETAHHAGLQVLVWTVNDAAEATRLRNAGIDGLTTDCPDLMLRLEQIKFTVPAASAAPTRG